jgi:hypothetical protein
MPKTAVRIGKESQDKIGQWLGQFDNLSQWFNDEASAGFRNILSGEQLQMFKDLFANIGDFRGSIDGLLQPQELSPELYEMFNSTIRPTIERGQEIVANNGRTARGDFLFDRVMDQMGQGIPRVVQEANGIFDRGGRTAELNRLTDLSKELTNFGGFTAELKDNEKLGQSIMGTQGRTPDTLKALQGFQGILDKGGRDAGTNALSAKGAGLVDSGGMTPELSQLLGSIQSTISQGGMTPEARQLFGKAMQIVNADGKGGALLPMDQVLSFAKDSAGVANKGAREAAVRQAVARSGSAEGSGLENAAFAEFADSAAENESKTIREALMGQQGLQLQQLMAAMGVGGDITKSATGLVGQAFGAGGDIARSASQNISTGAGLMSDAEQIAASRFGQARTGLNETFGTENNRLALGNDIFKTANTLAQGRLGMGAELGRGVEGLASGNLAQAFQGLIADGQFRQGAGQLAGTLQGQEFNREGNALNTILGAGQTGTNIALGGGQLDLERQKTLLSSTLQSFGLSSEVINNIMTSYLGASQGMAGIGNQYTNLTGQALNNYGNLSQQLIQTASQPGFWSRLAQTAVGGLVGGATAGFGNLLINKIPGSTGGAGPYGYPNGESGGG